MVTGQNVTIIVFFYYFTKLKNQNHGDCHCLIRRVCPAGSKQYSQQCRSSRRYFCCCWSGYCRCYSCPGRGWSGGRCWCRADGHVGLYEASLLCGRQWSVLSHLSHHQRIRLSPSLLRYDRSVWLLFKNL